jgi:DNA-binding winged helix-turn-helix (wHTH) protein
VGSKDCYEFGGYRLDPFRGQLLRIADRKSVSLTPRVLETLIYLVEHRGDLVTRRALIDALWPHTSVEENSLERNISLLRRALGESAREHRFIATVPSRGYRFVASVKCVRGPLDDAQSPEPDTAAGSEAYQLYVQALARAIQPGEQNMRAALALLERATLRDAKFTRAWSLLAVLHALCTVWDYPVPDTLASAERAARRSLAMEPGDGAPHTALGLVHAFRGEWLEAERHLSAADSLPNDPYFRGMRHMVTLAAGHIRRSVEEMQRVHLTGLAEPFAAQTLAAEHAMTGDSAEAQRYLDLAVSLGAPRTAPPYPDVAAQIALQAGLYDKAAMLMSESMAQLGHSPAAVRAVAGVYSALEKRDDIAAAVTALRAVEMQMRAQRLDQITRNRMLLWYTLLEAPDSAHELAEWCLDRYASEGTVGCVWFVVWLPEMRAFRRHPRFQRYVSRMKLTDYWKEYGAPDGCNLDGGKLICS